MHVLVEGVEYTLTLYICRGSDQRFIMVISVYSSVLHSYRSAHGFTKVRSTKRFVIYHEVSYAHDIPRHVNHEIKRARVRTTAVKLVL